MSIDDGLYGELAVRVDANERRDPKDPTTSLTATIETVDNDRAFGASGGGSGMPLP